MSRAAIISERVPAYQDGAGRPVADADVPLVVDVDGTLLRGDLLFEGALDVLVRRPRQLPGLVVALCHGRAALKAYIATESRLDVKPLPVRPEVLELMAQARAAGRRVVLASAAHESQVAALATHVGADLALGSSAQENLAGSAKLRALREHFTTFDYIGNARVDVPLWRDARQAYAVGLGAGARRAARRVRPDLQIVERPERGAQRAWLRELRVHQWAKNGLLFLPALAAHLPWNAGLLFHLVAGFAAFSALASAVYLINDLADLPHDRVHPTKRRRPLASGEISIPSAMLGAAALIAISVGLATMLPVAFGAILVGYFVLTTAYSCSLKRRALVDVITLATLYTTRVVAGAALADVALSRWFLAFSVFLFFSLALVKRVMELQQKGDLVQPVAGRGYTAADLPVLISLGASATAATSLVYCQYITSQAVTQLYGHVDFLWAGLPLSLYWQARVWLLTVRKRLHEDPIVFALRDRTSYLVLAAFLISVLLAA